MNIGSMWDVHLLCGFSGQYIDWLRFKNYKPLVYLFPISSCLTFDNSVKISMTSSEGSCTRGILLFYVSRGATMSPMAHMYKVLTVLLVGYNVDTLCP